MPVAAKAFQLWLGGVAAGASIADVCRQSGIKRSTLAQQLVRGKVAESSVVSVARAYGVDPVAALANFHPFQDLAGGVKPPTHWELVSQVSYQDLLRALLGRSAPERQPLTALDPVPHASSVRNWIDAIDQAGDLRQSLSAASGVAPQNISAQLTANRLNPDLAVEAARLAGAGLTGGLVATGLLTPEEAGWAAGARARAIEDLTDAELVNVARDRLDALSKLLRRREQDDEQTNALWENLG
ncbi:hypothetical protein KIH31_16335 [Paenarthrobacter sp. DKR-5]|uniref:hypothetical protein n=1 Tax=Paenarthrobacter sp. DKR-5 TaxID=2835535 RepID=UPI001BDC4BB4|nr:hypothetical protein [Paenarthrobacter sp. DKR-5]MBT1004155.1 hypothetical protein [Paenarthrobacter sp. DKR-5]